MTTMARRVLAAAVAGLACACAGCFGSDADKAGGTHKHAPVVLTMADVDFAARDVVEYANAVERLSSGSMRIDVRTLRTDEVDYDRVVVDEVRDDRFDMGKIAARSIDGMGVTDFQALVAPLLIDSLSLERTVLQSDLPSRMLPGVRRLGVVGVAILPGEVRRPFGMTRALAAPRDYRGATIGIRPSRVAEATFHALGATAKGYVSGRLSGFDGAELDPKTIEQSRYDVPGSSLTVNVGLWARPQVIVMPHKAYEALAPPQRRVLERAGEVALDASIARLSLDDRSETDLLCGRGRLRFVRATAADGAALRAAVRPVYAALEHNPSTKAAIDTIESLKRAAGDTPDTEPACRANSGGGATAAVPELEGVWTTTVTRAEGARAGAVRDELDSPNLWGHLRLELHGGRFIYLNESNGHVDHGRYSVIGDHITLRTVRDDVFPFRWSVYRDTLRLRKMAAGDLTTFATLEPWRRVS